MACFGAEIKKKKKKKKTEKKTFRILALLREIVIMAVIQYHLVLRNLSLYWAEVIHRYVSIFVSLESLYRARLEYSPYTVYTTDGFGECTPVISHGTCPVPPYCPVGGASVHVSSPNLLARESLRQQTHSPRLTNTEVNSAAV